MTRSHRRVAFRPVLETLGLRINPSDILVATAGPMENANWTTNAAFT